MTMTAPAPAERKAPWQPPVPAGEPRQVALSVMLLNVLESLCEGKSNSEIADDWGISEDTVKTHMRRLFRALNANNRLHAAALVWSGVVEVVPKPPGARWGAAHPGQLRPPPPGVSTTISEWL